MTIYPQELELVRPDSDFGLERLLALGRDAQRVAMLLQVGASWQPVVDADVHHPVDAFCGGQYRCLSALALAFPELLLPRTDPNIIASHGCISEDAGECARGHWGPSEPGPA